MRKGHRRERQVLGLVFFGSVAASVYVLAFSSPAWIVRLLRACAVLEVTGMVVWAVLAAYSCRKVVESVLRLCGFG